MGDRPRLVLLSLGGTIDSLGADRLDHARYHEQGRRLPPGALLASIPEASEVADIVEVPFPRRSSSALTHDDWLLLHRNVLVLLADGADGIVLTHGTNTLEETALFLHLSVPTDRPIVLVGALRPADALGSDGALNLLRAVQVAADEASAGQGALVVMDGTIYSARDVTKTATFRLGAFAAPDAGPLGYADADGAILYYHRHLRRPCPWGAATLDFLPRVDVVVSYVGADGTLIEASAAAGARGLVSAGTGAGRPTPLEEDALERAAASGVVICQSTRVGSGRVPPPTQPGWVTADNLPPWKARIALSLALARTPDPAEVQLLLDQL